MRTRLNNIRRKRRAAMVLAQQNPVSMTPPLPDPVKNFFARHPKADRVTGEGRNRVWRLAYTLLAVHRRPTSKQLAAAGL